MNFPSVGVHYYECDGSKSRQVIRIMIEVHESFSLLIFVLVNVHFHLMWREQHSGVLDF